ncbi:MAG: hypothetical protein ACKVP7_26365 [Hyphomicrobiaceae bacterium]
MASTKMWAAAAMVIVGGMALPLDSGSAATRKACVLAGGEATMITADLAKFMAEAALKNSIKDKGLTAAGAIKLSCTPGLASTHCLAKQRACK